MKLAIILSAMGLALANTVIGQCVTMRVTTNQQMKTIDTASLNQINGLVLLQPSKTALKKKWHKTHGVIAHVVVTDAVHRKDAPFITLYNKQGQVAHTFDQLNAHALQQIHKTLADKNYYYNEEVKYLNNKVVTLNHEFKELTIAAAADTSIVATNYLSFDKLYPNLSPIKAKQHQQLMKLMGVILQEDTEMRGMGVHNDKIYLFTNYINAYSDKLDEDDDKLSTHSCVQEIDAKGNVLQVFPVNYRSDLYAIKYLNQVIGDSLVILFDYNDNAPSNKLNPFDNYFIVRYKRAPGTQSYEFLDKLPLPINQYAKEMYGLNYNEMFNTGYPYFTSTYGNEIYNSVRNSFIKLQDDKQYMATFHFQKQKNASLKDSYQMVGVKAMGYAASLQHLFVVHQIDGKMHVSIYDNQDRLVKRINFSEKFNQQYDNKNITFDLYANTLVVTDPMDHKQTNLPLPLILEM